MEEENASFIPPVANNEFIPIETDLFNTAFRKKIDIPSQELRFLDFKLVTSGDESNIELDVNLAIVHVETFQIKAQVDKAQTALLSAIGIDQVAIIKSALINEAAMSTAKAMISLYDRLGNDHKQSRFSKRQRFLQKWFNLSFPTYVTDGIDIARKIVMYSNFIATSCRRGRGNFVIVSSKIHALLCDSPAYVGNLNNSVISNGSTFLNGAIGDIKIYVDPNTTSDHIIIGRSLTRVSDPEPGVVFLEYTRKFNTTEAPTTIHIALDSRHAITTIGKKESVRANYYTTDLEFKKRPYWRKLFNV
jgi:hypothetical protein